METPAFEPTGNEVAAPQVVARLHGAFGQLVALVPLPYPMETVSEAEGERVYARDDQRQYGRMTIEAWAATFGVTPEPLGYRPSDNTIAVLFVWYKEV